MTVLFRTCRILFEFPIFTARRYASVEYGFVLCSSVCLFVRHKWVFYKKQLNIGSRKQRRLLAVLI